MLLRLARFFSSMLSQFLKKLVALQGQIGNAFLCLWKYLYALEKGGSARPILFPQKSLLCAGSSAIFGIYAENSQKYYNNSMKHAALQVRNRTFFNELLT